MKKVLTFGPEPLSLKANVEWVHIPLLKIIPEPLQVRQNYLQAASEFDGVIITSKTTVPLLKEAGYEPDGRTFYAVGNATREQIIKYYPLATTHRATDERQEGLIDLLKTFNGRALFWPKAAQARTLLSKLSIVKSAIFYDSYPIYTRSSCPLLPFEKIDEILFTSPTTVTTFFHLYSPLPPCIQSKMRAIGPVTQSILTKFQRK